MLIESKGVKEKAQKELKRDLEIERITLAGK
jgi:hypothetical protein